MVHGAHGAMQTSKNAHLSYSLSEEYYRDLVPAGNQARHQLWSSQQVAVPDLVHRI